MAELRRHKSQQKQHHRINRMIKPRDGIINIRELAKLLEGEGSFSAHGGDVVVQLAMKDEDVVRWAAALVHPPSVRIRQMNNPKWSDVWVWSVTGRQAIMLAMILYPWMGQRRQSQIKKMFVNYTERPGYARRWKNGNAKLIQDQVNYILENPDDESRQILAEKFNVTDVTIGNIQRGISWQN